MIIFNNSPLPHLSMWLVAGTSGLHWQTFVFGSQNDPWKPQSWVLSHLSLNFLNPRVDGSEIK